MQKEDDKVGKQCSHEEERRREKGVRGKKIKTDLSKNQVQVLPFVHRSCLLLAISRDSSWAQISLNFSFILCKNRSA